MSGNGVNGHMVLEIGIYVRCAANDILECVRWACDQVNVSDALDEVLMSWIKCVWAVTSDRGLWRHKIDTLDGR